MQITDRSFDDPVIEVIAQSPRREVIMTKLRQVGFRAIALEGSPQRQLANTVLIDGVSHKGTFPNPDQYPERLFVFLKGDIAQPPHPNVLRLPDIDALPTLHPRLAIRRREQQRQREAQLRDRTAQLFGVRAEGTQTPTKPRFLWLGEQASFLNALRSDLHRKGGEFVAALTRLTAQDYLARGGFDALILHPASAADEASDFLSRYAPTVHASRTRLILLSSPVSTPVIGVTEARKADAILDTQADTHLLADRLFAYASDRPIGASSIHAQTSQITDRATRLASRKFFEAHLQAQMKLSDQTGEPLCVIALQVEKSVELNRIAQILPDHIRETDLATAFEAKTIMISAPSTAYRGAVSLARRIESASPIPVRTKVSERRQFHTVKTLLGGLTAAQSSPLLRRQA